MVAPSKSPAAIDGPLDRSVVGALLLRCLHLDATCAGALLLLGVANGLGQDSAASLRFQSQLATQPSSAIPFVTALVLVVAGLVSTMVRHWSLGQRCRAVLAGLAAGGFAGIVAFPYHSDAGANQPHCCAVTFAIATSTVYLVVQNVRAATHEHVLSRAALVLYLACLALYQTVELRSFGLDHFRALTDPMSPLPAIEAALMLSLLLAGVVAPAHSPDVSA